MLKNLIEKLKKEDVDFKSIDNDKELIVTFGIELSFSNIVCEFSYDKDEKVVRFYSELLEFNDDTFEDGLELVNDINYNSMFVKAYLDDDNILCAEYYISGIDELSNTLIDDLLSDVANLEELLEEYI